MSDNTEHLSFYSRGIEAELDEHGLRCRLLVSVDVRMHDGADAIHLEVLFQSRDERGLASGAPAVLYASTWPLRPPDAQGTATAEGWLPRALEPGLARRCHYRVTPIIMDPSRN